MSLFRRLASLTLFLGLSGNLPPATASPGETLTLTVEDTVRLALQRNLSLKESRLTHEAAGDAWSSAWGSYDPVLSSSTSVTSSYQSPPGMDVSLSLPTGGSAGVSLDWTTAYVTDDGRITQAAGDAPTVTVSLSQPLLDGLILSGTQQSLLDAREGLRISFIRLEEALTSLAVEAEDAYWGVVQAQEEVRAARQSLEFSQEQEKVTLERIAEGFQAPIDILQVQEQRAGAEARVESARASLADAEDSLRVLLDLPLGGEQVQALSLTSTPGVVKEDGGVDESVSRALSTGFPVRSAIRALHLARSHRPFAFSRALPDLSANVGLTYVPDGADPADERESLEWQVGATLTLPLSPRGPLLEARAAAREVRSAEIALQQAQASAERSARSSYRALQNQERQVQLAEERITYAEKKLAAEKEKLDRGESTLKNVLDFLVDRDDASRDLNSARIAWRRALASLLQVEGTLLARYGVDTESWWRGKR